MGCLELALHAKYEMIWRPFTLQTQRLKTGQYTVHQMVVVMKRIICYCTQKRRANLLPFCLLFLIFYGNRNLLSFVLSCDLLVCVLLRNLLIAASSHNCHIQARKTSSTPKYWNVEARKCVCSFAQDNLQPSWEHDLLVFLQVAPQ